MILIRHIDEIARQQGHDVLYLEFHPADRALARGFDLIRDPLRIAVIDWLDAHSVRWEPCGPFAVVHRIEGYRGQVYLDIPFDEKSDLYQEVRRFLEHDDGSTRHAGVRFLIMPLAHAMENAAHDAPGFWEQFGIS
jgi:hypothetical protein